MPKYIVLFSNGTWLASFTLEGARQALKRKNDPNGFIIHNGGKVMDDEVDDPIT